MFEDLENSFAESNPKCYYLNKLNLLYRVLLVLSILWIVLTLIDIEPWITSTRGRGSYNDWDEFLLVGLLPIIIFWSILWIWSGYKEKFNSDKSGLSKYEKSIACSLAALSVLVQSRHKGDAAKDFIKNEYKISKHDIQIYRYYENIQTTIIEKVNNYILKRG